MNIYTEQDYIDKCNELGLEYIGFHREKHKGTVVEFICKKHKNKGIQAKNWTHFKNAKIGCPFCYGRNKTTEEFISEITNKDVIVLSEYKGLEKPIKCKCAKCGNVWTTQARVLSKNNGGCPICGIEKRNKAESKTQETFEKELSEKNPFIEIQGIYINTHTKIQCKCKICGKIWDGYPANLLNGSAGCPYCSSSDGERKMLKLLDEFNINYQTQYTFNDCKNIFPLKYDAYDEINKVAFEYNGEQHYINSQIRGHYVDNEELLLNQKRDNIKIDYCNKNEISLIIIPYWEKDNMRDFLLSEFKKKGIYC